MYNNDPGWTGQSQHREETNFISGYKRIILRGWWTTWPFLKCSTTEKTSREKTKEGWNTHYSYQHLRMIDSIFVPGALPALNCQGHNADQLKHRQRHGSWPWKWVDKRTQFAITVFALSFWIIFFMFLCLYLFKDFKICTRIPLILAPFYVRCIKHNFR